jgi:hypothetical protein
MIRAQEIELDLASERGRCAMADEIADVVSANGASALRGQNPLLNVSVGSKAEVVPLERHVRFTPGSRHHADSPLADLNSQRSPQMSGISRL